MKKYINLFFIYLHVKLNSTKSCIKTSFDITFPAMSNMPNTRRVIGTRTVQLELHIAGYSLSLPQKRSLRDLSTL